MSGAGQVVHFHFDYLSPFAYFAFRQLPALCDEAGAELRLHPVLFAGLLDHWGQRGPAEIPPKAIHTFKLCARYAAANGIAVRSPRYHPFRPLTALRVSLAEVAGADQLRVVAAVFDAGWGQGADLGDVGAIAAALDAAGLDGAALVARTQEPAAKRQLQEATERAIACGVFGVPTMLVDDELFWGVDQLPFLALYLAGRDPLAGVDLEAIRSEGRAAERPASRAGRR